LLDVSENAVVRDPGTGDYDIAEKIQQYMRQNAIEDVALQLRLGKAVWR
jgi:hypothetical protein